MVNEFTFALNIMRYRFHRHLAMLFYVQRVDVLLISQFTGENM
jgi:hypothetical protein